MLARETDPPLLHSLNSSFSLFIVSCVPRIKHIHALFPLEAENNFAKVSFFPFSRESYSPRPTFDISFLSRHKRWWDAFPGRMRENEDHYKLSQRQQKLYSQFVHLGIDFSSLNNVHLDRNCSAKFRWGTRRDLRFDKKGTEFSPETHLYSFFFIPNAPRGTQAMWRNSQELSLTHTRPDRRSKNGTRSLFSRASERKRDEYPFTLALSLFVLVSVSVRKKSVFLCIEKNCACSEYEPASDLSIWIPKKMLRGIVVKEPIYFFSLSSFLLF